MASIVKHLKHPSNPSTLQSLESLQQMTDIGAHNQEKIATYLMQYLAIDGRTAYTIAALHALRALDMLKDRSSLQEQVLVLAHSKSRRVRMAVAQNLSYFASWDEDREDFFADDATVATTLTLSSDSSPSVRDWAVFQFNNGIANDSLAIRSALDSRTDDVYLPVRQEATVALIARGDTRFYSLIAKKLERIDVAPVWIEAAGVSGSEFFVRYLETLLAKRIQSSLYTRRGAIDDIKTALANIENKCNEGRMRR